MTTQATITGLYSLLTSDQTSGSFYDDLGGRIHEGVAPEEEALPHMVYVEIADPPINYLGGSSDIEMQVQLDIYAERRLGPNALGNIHTKVLTALEGASVTIAGHVGGQFEFTERGRYIIDGDARRVTMEALITANT